MSNLVFQQIIQGKQIPLTESQLAQFQIFCSTQSLSLDKWNDISLILFQQKREHCLHFLQFLQKNQLSKPLYNDFIHQDNKVRVYNNLFALLLTKATKQHSKLDIDRLVSEAKKYLGESEKVKMTNNVISRAFLQYFDGQLSKATNMFNKSLQSSQSAGFPGQQNKMIGMLGLAQIYFLKRNYSKSLQLYRKVLSTHKTLPIKARLGMAYCYFNLQRFQMARACFNRILKLDPNCVEAYIGLGVVQQKDENFVQYFRCLTKAARVGRSNPLVLLHLSEHYLLRGDLQRTNSFAFEGLVQVQSMSKFFVKANRSEDIQSFRKDYLQLKARFNNILGQSQHIKNNFLQALKHYRLASNQGLTYNQVYLSQIYTHPVCQNYVQGLQILQNLFKSPRKSQVRLLNQSIKDMAYLKAKNPIPLTQQLKSSQDYYNQAIGYNKHDIQVKIQLSNQIIQVKKARSLRLLLSAYNILSIQSESLVKPQLLNNIGVLHLENQENIQANSFLTLCVHKLKMMNEKIMNEKAINQKIADQKIMDQEIKNQKIIDQKIGAQVSHNNHNEHHHSSLHHTHGNDHNHTNNSEQAVQQYSIRTNANYLISLFNLGIAKEKLSLYSQAVEIYEQIIRINKYFIDAHIRLAYIHFTRGNIKSAMQVLEDGMSQSQNSQSRFIRFDKVLSMKAAILKLWGDQVSAKDVLKQVGKTTKDIYTQIHELSIIYDTVLKRQPQTSTLKDFLRPNRQIYMKYCHQDPNNAFVYLVLCVILLTDRRVSLKQGTQLFSQLKQHVSEQIPIILYNMGLFFLNYDDYEKAKYVFRSYSQKSGDQRGQQLFALASLLDGEFQKSIKSVKRNILLNPTSVKNRYQLIYASEKKCEQERNDDKAKLRSNLSGHLQTLKKCFKFYTFFSKLNINDYIKYFQSPDNKQLTKNLGQKIRTISEERKFYASSNIDYYQKLQKDQLNRQREEQERLARNTSANTGRAVAGLGMASRIQAQDDHLDDSDSEQIRRRKREEKKRVALQLGRKKDQEFTQKWIDIKDREREQKEKKVARATRQPRQKGTKRRQKRLKAANSQDSVQYQSQPSFNDQDAKESPSEASLEGENQDVEAPKRKRREQRREQRRERKKRIKKQRLSKPQHSDEDLSQNPFDSPHQSQKQKRQADSSSERNEIRKKKRQEKEKEKQKDKEQEDQIDMDKYMVM